MNQNTKRAEVLKFLCLGVSYAFSYTYIRQFYLPDLSALMHTVILTILGAVAVLWLELTMLQQKLLGKSHQTKKARIETFFWEAILLLLCANTYFGFWPGLTLFLIHPVLIYTVLLGTGHLLADRSSVFLAGDMVNGTFRIPFCNFGARILSVIESIKARTKAPSSQTVSSSATVPFTAENPSHPKYSAAATMPIPVPQGTPNNISGQGTTYAKDPASYGAGKVFGIIGILILVLIIFIEAFDNLASMDGNFKYVSDSIDHFLANLSIAETIFWFIFSIPIGMYLFGLFQGSVRFDPAKEHAFHARVTERSTSLRILPNVILTFILGLFVLVYLAFFVSQANYMFSAFAGVLPKEFTASEYAVSGFHELINVVLINFVLMSVIRVFGSHEHRLVKAGSIALMAESCIFACISASKILLYMSRFGFTASRTLGLWGTAVVFVGAGLTIVHLLTKKKTFAPWLWFSVASYVVMQFAAFPYA